MDTVVQLFRVYSEQGTFGTLFTDGFSCATVERPWKDNEQSISCIPEGTYRCEFGKSSRNIPISDKAYEVLNVPKRTSIKIHVANWPEDLEGCIGLGEEVLVVAGGRRMVTRSGPTIKRFHEHFNGEPFTLVVGKAQ